MPKPEGYKFVTDADAEMHYLSKAILLRPIYLLDELEDNETKLKLQLRAFRALCTAPEDEAPWPALNGGPDAPGPFERGWKRFWQEQRQLVLQAQQKTLSQPGNAESWSSPSLWNTREMEEELEQARESYLEEEAQELDEQGQTGASVRLSLLKEAAPGRREGLSNSWPFRSVREDLLSVSEYNALQTLSNARNYDGIAHARAEKPKR